MKWLGPLSVAFLGLGVATASAAPNCAYSVTGPTLTFDDTLTVEPGESASCELDADSADPHAADTFVVYSADYRGSVEDGDTATIEVEHDGTADGAQVTGPQPVPDGPPLYRNYLSSDTAGIIHSTLNWSLPAGGGAPASIDTVDYGEVARTTAGIVQASIDEVAASRTGILVHLNATSALLTNDNQPIRIPDSVSLIGALGSHTVGATAHLNLTDGISLDGGAALFDQGTDTASASGVLLNGKLSYLMPDDQPLRPYGAIGLRAAPGMTAHFTRSYDDSTEDGAIGKSAVSGNLFGVYAEGGVLFAPDANNEILFSASLARDWMNADAASESFSEDNIFAASFDSGTAAFDTIKAGARWTTKLDEQLDLTVSGAVGHTFAHDDLAAEVAFAGDYAGAAADETFVEYGARLGWQFDPTLRADAFVAGSTGSESGTHVQVGAGLRRQF